MMPGVAIEIRAIRVAIIAAACCQLATRYQHALQPISCRRLISLLLRRSRRYAITITPRFAAFLSLCH